MASKVLHIVVVFNGMKWLPQLVDSVQASGTGDVWAIDHGSTDGSWEWLTQRLPESERQQGPNHGFGSGNNRGLEEAIRRGVDAVHLLNQDAKVDPQGMVRQVEWLMSRSACGHRLEVSSPIHWDWDGAQPYHHFDKHYAPQWREHQQPFEVPFIHAASWLMTLDTVKTVGGFNPAFFMYGEDNEWAHRFRRLGGRFWIHPEASLYHDEKVRPWPKTTVLERMAYAEEVRGFFEGTLSAEQWSNLRWSRSVRRATHPDRWLDVVTGAMWRAERQALRRMKADVATWALLRDAMNQQTYPHLNP